MAKIISVFGNMIVYVDKNGKIRIRNKPNYNKAKRNPAYQRTRINAAAFGKAASAGKLLRQAFQSWLQKIGDKQISNRLMAVLLKAIKGGTHANQLKPQVADGELALLEGFDFNPVSLLQHVFTSSFSVETANEGKQVLVKLPAFIAGKSAFQLPTSFTHFKLTPMAVVFDFENRKYQITKAEPAAPVALNGETVQPVAFTVDIQTGEKTVMVIAISIEFYQSVNGWDGVPVAAGEYDVLGVVKVVSGYV